MTKRSIGFLLAGGVLALVATAPAGAQQARMELGRDFLGYNEDHKREVVAELMQGDPSGVKLCEPGIAADELAGRFTAWIEQNPEAATEPLSVGFTQMLEDTCDK